MPLLIGLDVGTTTIAAVAVDEHGVAKAAASRGNDANCTSPRGRQRGYSEWDPERVLALSAAVLNDLRLPADGVAGLAVTGQQHGCLLVDADLRPQTPFINWQDRRGVEPFPGSARSFVDEAIARCGDGVEFRSGCRLAPGYASATLFWLRQNQQLPTSARLMFISDLVACRLTGAAPATDPTLAASAGILDLPTGRWDEDAIAALDLPRELFPDVRPTGSLLGRLVPEAASECGLPPGTPVFVGLGDHQASFLGSVSDRAGSVLVNVGTGGQVAAWLREFRRVPGLETRPFPGESHELVAAGLTGGRVYAVLERFFAGVLHEFAGVSSERLFARMNELAAAAPPGADGLCCEPYFAGTRADPTRRASLLGLIESNFTPGHVCRALLEGMARTFREQRDLIVRELGGNRPVVVGAGNGIRANPLLARIIGEQFGPTIRIPRHREEAAYGAAITAAVGAGLLPGFNRGNTWIQYE